MVFGSFSYYFFPSGWTRKRDNVYFCRMGLLLNIESATPVCSVALCHDGKLLSMETSSEKNLHSEKLTLFVEGVMAKAGHELKDLEAVAVSEGPGSYTGLRIGASVAKGLCYSLNIPLIAVNTLRAIVESMKLQYYDDEALYCPMIDARRMDVYTALYDVSGTEAEAISVKTIDETSFRDALTTRRIVFGGDGAEKCKRVLNNPNALFPESLEYSALGMSVLAERKWKAKEFADTAYFEPFYLKEFQPGKPSVKGLHE